MMTPTPSHSTPTPPPAPIIGLLRKFMSDFAILIITAVIVGVLCGVAAYLFKLLLNIISGWFMPHISATSVNWWLLGIPVAGIILTALFTRYVVRDNPSHCCAHIISDISKRDYRLRGDLVYSPIVASSITLGMGGTSGSEGPIAYSGAAIGSNIGKLLRLDDHSLKTLMACGMSAGIAGIFIAPIGGVLFALEAIRIRISTKAVLAVVASCIAAFLTALWLNGFAPNMLFDSPTFGETSHFGGVAALGLFCGIYSIYYSSSSDATDKLFLKIKTPLVGNILGGLMIGVCLLLFPSMYCVGYPIISEVINGHPEALATGSVMSHALSGDIMLIASCGGILLLKCWGVGATNSSGGVGGDFAPTLFAGCMAGYLFAAGSNMWFGTDYPVSLFAFLGMAGVMAGAIEAPLMTIFIVMEMTRTFDYALPVVTVSTISYVTVLCGKKTIHDIPRMIVHHNLFHH